MAHGYYQATGKLGVCFSTTGPGATNMINGVASAYENHVPLLAITAQTALSNFGRGALQESSCTGVNTVGIYSHFTRYNTFVSHVNQLEHKIASSIIAAFQPPGGPVHLSIPIDILRSRHVSDQVSFNLPSYLDPPSLLDETAVAKLCELLVTAKKPVFVIGNSCAASVGTLLELALLLGAPIITTPHGKGLVSPYHPLYRGVVGFAGHLSANNTLSDSKVDLIVAAGTNLGEWSTNGWDKDLLLNERLVHVDDMFILINGNDAFRHA